MRELGIKLLTVKNMIKNNLDRFGYYTVGGMRTYSKLQAIEWHDKTGNHPVWNFNEDVFDCYDWSQEPKISLSELYRRRAQHLREQYDYLVLFYSGGSDSTNILDTFVNNDIKLDECASFWSRSADNDLDSHFSQEVARVAIPRMQKHTTIRHRLIDLSEITNEVYNNPEVKFDWIYFMSNYFSPNNYVRSHLRRLIQDYRRLIDSGSRVCFIWGSEKPRLHLVDGRYCVRFQDIIDNTVSPWLQQNPLPGEFDELFYWSPDWTTGIIKQAHIVMNYLKRANLDPVFFSDHRQSHHYGITVRNGQQWCLTANGINHLLYPSWNIHTLSVGKPRSPVWSQRDDWFFKTISWNPAAINFFNGFMKLNQILTEKNSNYWKNTPDNLLNGVKGCMSKPYFLE